MSDLPKHPVLRFCPAMMNVKMLRLLYRKTNFNSTYKALAASYADRYARVYDPGEYRWREVQDVVDDYVYQGGTLTSPWVDYVTSTGWEPSIEFWPLSEPAPDPPNEAFASAAVTGYVLYQMYALELVQQGLRFTKGHFGRKPNH